MFTSNREKLYKQLASLYYHDGSFPDYELLYDLVCDYQSNPDWEKRKYLTKLYWALKDLRTIVHRDLISITNINEETREVTYSTKRIYANKVGAEQREDTHHLYEEPTFTALYANRKQELYDQDPIVYSCSKLDTLEPNPTDEQVFEEFAETSNGGMEAKVDKLFEPIVDHNYRRNTFEKFVEEWLEKPLGTRKTVKDRVYNSLADLLESPDSLDTYIGALRTFQQRNNLIVIDNNGGFINKKGNISILLAWWDALVESGKVKHRGVRDQELARLLNIQFSGLDLDTKDASSVRKFTTTRYSYTSDF